MDPRKLKRLLDTYREAGVSEVQLDANLQPTHVIFGAALPLVPEGDVQGVDDTWKDGAPTGLQAAVERIQKAYAPKAKGAKAS